MDVETIQKISYVVIALLFMVILWQYKVDKAEDIDMNLCVQAKNSCNSTLTAAQKQSELWTATRNYFGTYNLTNATLKQMQAGGQGVNNAVYQAYKNQQAAILAQQLSAIQTKATELGISNNALYEGGYMPAGLN